MGSPYEWEYDFEADDEPFIHDWASAVAAKLRPDPRAEAAAEIWYAAYADEPATFDALVAKLTDLFPEMTEQLEPILLGSHAGGDEECDAPGADGLLAWLRSELGWIGAGHGDLVRDDDVALVEAHSRELWEAVRRALVPDVRARSRMADVPDQGVVPAAGRREVFLLGTGVVPVLWRMPARQHVTVEEQATIYVDVSGSMNVVLPFVIGLVRHLGDHAGRVFQFSNAVEPLDADALRRGRIRTTGGTDFDCVARHMLARRTRRAVIVTDGEADLSAPLERDLARRTKLFVVLTQEHPECPLLALAGRHARDRTWWVLPPALRAAT